MHDVGLGRTTNINETFGNITNMTTNLIDDIGVEETDYFIKDFNNSQLE